MAVQEKVKSIIAEQLGVKPEEVTAEASIRLLFVLIEKS